MAVSGSGDGKQMQWKRNRPPPATSPPEVEHCLTPLREERERRFSYKRKSGNHFSQKSWLLQIISSFCAVNLVHFSSPALFPLLLAHSICGEHPERKKKMERNTPVRKPHTSTADLLAWPETPPLVDPPVPDSAARRPHKPLGGISPALFGGPMTEEEAESVNKRKPSSGPKLKEMIGSGIFSIVNENDISELDSSLKNPNDRTSVKIYQQTISGISQISFSAEETVSPRKPTSLPEVAKQRELSGSLVSAAEDTTKKQPSDAKTRELSGHDIFGPPPEVLPRPLAARNLELKGQLDFGEPAPQSTRTPVTVPNPAGGQSNFMSTSEQPVPKTSKKISNQKFHDLTGNDIFKSDAASASAEKPLSSAKLKEMSGSDIFADGKAASREYFGGVRKPPGGGSSIALV